jgi:flavin-dependent dehydrogenase
MTGDGLRFAIRGGELAAQAVLSTMEGKVARPHLALREARQKEFAAKWRFNRALRRLVAAPLTVEAAGVVAFAVPALLRRTIRFAGDVDVSHEAGSAGEQEIRQDAGAESRQG